VSAPRHATVLARILIDELARAGVDQICLAPGSRSTPLVLAAASRPGFRLRVFLDERSAAFFALGWGRATGRPAAVVTTSGTAVANLLPAVVEASQGEVPLVLLTADRPPRLRDADANQAIVQPGIFGDYVRFHTDLAGPLEQAAEYRHLGAVAGRAVAAAVGWPAGPVHLNLPFDKPLEPGEAPSAGSLTPGPGSGDVGRPHGAPWVRVTPRRPRASDDEIEALAARISGAERPVLVAGPHASAGELGPAVRSLAAALEAPLLADPLSGGRYGADAVAAPVHYDLFLGDGPVARALAPDLIVRVGQAPTSAALLAWMEAWSGTEQVVVDGGLRWKDHLATASTYLQADAADALGRVRARLGATKAGRTGWTDRWERADRAARDALGALAPDHAHEGRILAAVVGALPGGTPLFVSSSMPVRDLDAYGGAAPGPLPVFANRGASGIDGIVSSALGVAAGAARPVVAVVGDLALLHDVNGLLATREDDARVVFVVVNNDGGGIFHFLPVSEHEPAFTPYFATPHGIEPARAAALYGVGHRLVDGAAALAEALPGALASGRSAILEVRTDRARNRDAHAAAAEAVRRAARAALDLPL
jgi:2-succinyl-5-enolpyruvyl-6-hydroxy-3-cyclohexene-1-carboxylate synthase